MPYCEYRIIATPDKTIPTEGASENALTNKPICRVLQIHKAEDDACVLPDEPGVTCPIALYNKGTITTVENLFHQLKPKYDSAKEQQAPEGK